MDAAVRRLPSLKEPDASFERPAPMARLTTLLLLAFVATACGSGPAASPSGQPSPAPSTAPPGSSSGGVPGDVAAFGGALRAAGATVTELGTFDPDPLGGRGVRLCVSGQLINVYTFDTEQDRQAEADRIDPDDPGNLGTVMVSWAGKPRFWQRDRILVLYLGEDPAVEAGISGVLGQPFARGEGRPPPGPDSNAC